MNPNPVTDKLLITLFQSVSPVSISIITLTGSEIFKVQTTDEQLTIDFSSYPTGLYFLQIDTRKGKMVKKIIHN